MEIMQKLAFVTTATVAAAPAMAATDDTSAKLKILDKVLKTDRMAVRIAEQRAAEAEAKDMALEQSAENTNSQEIWVAAEDLVTARENVKMAEKNLEQDEIQEAKLSLLSAERKATY